MLLALQYEHSTVRFRPSTGRDIKPYDVQFGQAPQPPQDVKGDPARLALWNKRQKEKEDAVGKSCEVFEARGCAQQVLFCCRYADHRRSGGAGGVSCSKGEYPAGAAKWE